MKPNIPMKYAFFILVAGTLLACGCMEPNTVNAEGEWIILPASEVWPEYSGYTSVSDKPTGDYQGLVIDTVPEYLPVVSGENVSIDVIFGNRGGSPIVIDNFPPAFFIKDPADLSNPARITRRYLRGDDTATIEPGGSIVHTIQWDQRNDRGFRVAPAIYVLEIADVMRYDGKTESIHKGSLGEQIAEIAIRPAGGTLERTIVENRSITEKGITVTLESVDAKADYVEMVFSVSAEDPDYIEVMPDGREWTYTISDDEPIHGTYRIDDGKVRYLWNVESTGGKNFHYGYRCKIESLPRDVENLSVTIDSFGPIQVSWDFNINF
ncbi:MAG: hypothetical protein KO173_06675 [Methanoregulaceae archaeon]|nr:hypothetical protein [Methanoregulaceae archaeon]